LWRGRGAHRKSGFQPELRGAVDNALPLPVCFLVRISDFEFQEEHEALLNATGQRNWLFVGLSVSLVIHLLLCAYFYRTRFAGAEFAFATTKEPPTFKVKSINTQATLEKASIDQTNPAAKPEPDKTNVQLPDEKKSFDALLQEVHATTAMPDDMANVLPDTPKVDPADATSVLNEIDKSTAQTFAKSPNATREQMLNESANSGRPQPALSGAELATSTTIKRPSSFTSKVQADSAGPSKGRNPGFSDLDSLLAQKGPLGSGTSIRMPDDQLFSYNSADLQESSMVQLQKLATLIKRNPKATFSIEGYTDAFGSYDYNLDLSQRRADSVAGYLVNMLGINPRQIQARGYGATKFLVAPRPTMGEDEAEIARQQPNRRVVVVVHTTGE
jgi:outer membrane protein OmpA-like peptidoglycan-associated protein